MTITHAEIRHVLSQYLDRYPGEVSDMALLFHVLNEGHEVTSRAEFRTGHVTASAVVLNSEERVLLIRHLRVSENHHVPATWGQSGALRRCRRRS